MIDNSELYQRQQSLGVNSDQSVAIIGCGGIGSWIAMYLALAGVGQDCLLDLYDGDKIEAHNLNRFPLGPAAIGKYKSEALAAEIMRLRPEINVTPRMHFDPELHRDHLRRYHWVIVTTDSLKSRRMVYNTVTKFKRDYNLRKGPQYIEAGADGTQMTVSFSPAEFQTEEEDNPGYRSVPVMVGPCTLAASIVTYYVLMGQPCDDSFYATWIPGVNTLNMLKISEASEPDLHDDEADDIMAGSESTREVER